MMPDHPPPPNPPNPSQPRGVNRTRRALEWLTRPSLDLHPGLEIVGRWSFIVDGRLDYGADEDHNWGVAFANGRWYCAGCLARPDRSHPSLTQAPNGLMLHMRFLHPNDTVVRQPSCPKR